MEYIYMNQFVTSDEPLNPEVYEIGSTLTDYKQGKYVPLNEDQINYMQEHPYADQQEVFLMHPTSSVMYVETLADKANAYFNDNYNFVLINGEKHFLWEYQDILNKAELLKWAGRDSIEFISNDEVFNVGVDTAINMMKQIGIYYYDAYRVINQHYRYIQEHPNDIDYDYTTGYPTVLTYDIN